jgi:hypothetical protein
MTMRLIDVEPCAELHQRILSLIKKRQVRIARTITVAMGFLSALSLTGLVFAIQYTAAELSHSGFFQYFSLLFSDSSTVVSLWREFALSLADSLPVVGIIIVLSAAAALFASIKGLIKNNFRIKQNYGY